MNVIGIDVSKQKLHCTLLREQLPDKKLDKVVANNVEGVKLLLSFASKKAKLAATDLLIVLEATSTYHEVAAEALFHAGCKVIVANPAQARNLAKGLGIRNKNDQIDALVLAQLGQQCHNKLRLWQPPPAEYKQLKQLQARKQALETDRQRESNRLEKLHATYTEAFILESSERMLQHLDHELVLVNEAIDTHIQTHPELEHDRGLLRSIPAIGTVLSTLLLAILQRNRFQSARQAAAYLGVVPVTEESGTSIKKRPRLSKTGNPTIRAKLYMAAVVATQHNPDIKLFYHRLLEQGKSKMSALGAGMRKLIHICFAVLDKQTEYSPQIA